MQRIINILVIAIIVTFPLAVNIALIPNDDPGHPIIALNLTVADLLIGLALLIWVIKVIINKEVKRIKIPPAPILIFLFVCAISVINAFSITEWAKELIQFIEYLFLFYILLINNPYTLRPKVITNILLGFSTVILLVAFYQNFVLDGAPYLIRGFFENRNILGTFLCMTIPLVYGRFIYSSNLFHRIWLVLLMGLVLLVLLSGSALISILISLLIMSIIISRKLLYRFIIATLLIGVLCPFIMPEKNVRALAEFATIYEKGDINDNFYRRLTILGDLKKTVLFNKQIGDKSIAITSDLLMSPIMPEIRQGDRYSDMSGEKHIKNHYLEMQAALSMTAENTFIGAGLGNFQSNIGKFYNRLPKVNTSEPNQHNGYLILSSTLGVLGLAAFFMMLSFYGRNAIVLFNNADKADHKGLYIGLCGSIIVCAINNLFCVLLVSVLMIPLVLIFALLTTDNNS